MSVIKLSELDEIDFNIDNYLPLYNKYEEDLSSYISAFSGDRGRSSHIASRHKLNELTAKWSEVLGFASDKIISDIRELQTPKSSFKTSYSIREAVNSYAPGGNWLIPNLLRSTGMYILGGEPKAGKSLLVYHLIFSMTISQFFLGKPVKAGKVLFLQLEEPEEVISERLFYTGFGDMADGETSLVLNFKDIGRIERVFDATTDINWLISLINEYQPALTIIDSLRKATMSSPASENSNEMGKIVYSLQQVFNFTNTCGILIHHMNKPSGGRNSKKIGLIERLSGHASISGACDGIIGISAEETDSGRLMTLKTLPRSGTSITIQYKMNQAVSGLWELEKISEDTPASTPTTSKILRFLSQSPGNYFSGLAIAKEIGVDFRDVNFKQSISYLQASQIIASIYKKKSLMYCLANDSMWIINPKQVHEDLQNEEIQDANTLMKSATKRELRAFMKECGKERYYLAIELLLESEKFRLAMLQLSWEFEIGEVVTYKGKLATVITRINEENPTFNKNYYELEGHEGKVLETDLEPIELEDEPDFDEEFGDNGIDDDLDSVFIDEYDGQTIEVTATLQVNSLNQVAELVEEMDDVEFDIDLLGF